MHWKQERPEWCPHPSCNFKQRAMDDICGGHLPVPIVHDNDFNIYRLCLNGVADNGGVFDLQVNKTDLFWLRKILDARDKKL